eukprot:635042-Pleurochrysis_carterae.AAC.1
MYIEAKRSNIRTHRRARACDRLDEMVTTLSALPTTIFYKKLELGANRLCRPAPRSEQSRISMSPVSAYRLVSSNHRGGWRMAHLSGASSSISLEEVRAEDEAPDEGGEAER